MTLGRLDTESWGESRARILWIGAGLLATILFLVGTYAITWTPQYRSLPAPHRLAPPAPAGAAASSPTAALDGPQLFEPVTPDQAVLINASVPVAKGPNPAAAPFSLGDASAADRANALNCLAMAVYYEAATQPPQGQAAVAQVVLNRVRNPHFPKSVCGVVFEGSNLPTGCQFTFTCDGSLLRVPDPTLWKNARQVAQRALDGYVQKDVGLATHYHAIYVVPYWQSSVLKISQIGAHVFYKMQGGLGQPAAFTAPYGGAEVIPATVLALDNDLSGILGKTAPASFIAPPAPAAVAEQADDDKPVAPPKPVEVAAQAAATVIQPSAAKVPVMETLDTRVRYLPQGEQRAPRLPMAGP